MAELAVIEALKRSLGTRGERILRGPGDDAAVVRARPFAVTSLDAFVEGVHFRRSTHSPADVGHAALASALSDLAAMGAGPGEAYVGLVLPEGFGDEAALALIEAAESLAARVGVTIAGGDVSSGPALAVTAAVTGWAERAEALVGRDGARAGDLVGVTGELGGSGGGLRLLKGSLEVELPARVEQGLLVRHRRPEPLLSAGAALAAAGASAMIDVSDGVATDARHLAEASAAALRIELDRLPLAKGVPEVARAAGEEPARFAAAAGEDFELLLCGPPERRESLERAAAGAGSGLTWIGEVPSAGGGVEMLGREADAGELRGYEHGGAPGGLRDRAQRRSAERVPPSEPGPA